ncbi:MAG: hypothetical protein COA43_07920 [Robiginitomaculum sp.]|nr:MAG: hypothetical protein COA43_07920 [Robiginitomaculum sp.]
MGNLFLSPNGKIGSAEFIRAGFILILVGAALSVPGSVSKSLGVLFGLLTYCLAFPWIIIWVKRLRTGDKSGWMVMAYMAMYFAFLVIGASIVLIGFGGEEFVGILNEKISNEISQTEYMERIEGFSKQLFLPLTISGLLASLLTLFIADRAIPQYEGDTP